MKYLLFNTKEAAFDRSMQEADIRSCGRSTKYWWGTSITKAGKWALCIPDDETSHLTPTEKSNLKDSVVWPEPVDPS